MTCVKYMPDPASYLVDTGLLFEINRRILHPYGLAMAVSFPDGLQEHDKTATSAPILLWDNRDDPEGVYFAPETFKEGAAKLSITVETFKNVGKFETRRKALGYVIQGMSPDQTAQRAYKAYSDSMECLNQDNSMPEWEDLPPKIKTAWRCAVKAVVEP